MARVQTRRTVSMSRGTKTRLAEYCESNGIPESALVEFLVEQQLDRPLDRVAYEAYRTRAVERAWKAQRAGGRATASEAPGQYAHLFGRRCGRCRQQGHTVYTCPGVLA